jgi:hypothetical protein
MSASEPETSRLFSQQLAVERVRKPIDLQNQAASAADIAASSHQ